MEVKTSATDGRNINHNNNDAFVFRMPPVRLFQSSKQKTSISGKFKDALMYHLALCLLVYALQSQGHRQNHMFGIDSRQCRLICNQAVRAV